MLKLEKFDGTKTYMFPTGKLATPEIMVRKYPALEHFTHIIEVNGDVCQAIMNLEAMRQMHDIDPALSEDDAIAALEVIINTPDEPDPDYQSPEMRIAAALEEQNEMAKGDYLQLNEKIEALLLVASKQVDDLEFSEAEKEILEKHFELGPGKDPGFGEGIKDKEVWSWPS